MLERKVKMKALKSKNEISEKPPEPRLKEAQKKQEINMILNMDCGHMGKPLKSKTWE